MRILVHGGICGRPECARGEKQNSRKRPGGYYDTPPRVTCDKQHAHGGKMAEALEKSVKNTVVDLYLQV